MDQAYRRYFNAAKTCVAAAERTADVAVRASLLDMTMKLIELSDEAAARQERFDTALDHFNHGQMYAPLTDGERWH
jgi:hypothetical protein